MGVDFQDALFGGILGLILSLFLGPIFWAKGLFTRKSTLENPETGEKITPDQLKARLDQAMATEQAKA